MRIDAINIKKEGQLIADYRENKQEIMQFFDYHPFLDFKERVSELKKRSYKREELSTQLKKLNRAWGASESTMNNIGKLKEQETLVVIGGQQAGLLTGPLYSINKVISIIQLAKQQERALGVPVIPVFWIAGEDHDYDEINHVYMPEGATLKKCKFNQSLYKKTSVSHIELDKDLCRKWLDHLFAELQETEYTRDLYEGLMDSVDESISFTDFFANIIFKLFQDEGLVLVDAAADEIRSLESNYFIELIEKQNKISHGVYEAAEALKRKDYTLSLEVKPSDGHLFYQMDEERILLERTDDGNWKGKQNEIQLTTEELLHIAVNKPEHLSNNVVSRPLMQELLFPTLAFVGGPGEISYWAALKQAFHSLEVKMPPVVPRLSYTYVPAKVRKALELTGIELESAIQNGTETEREDWLKSKQNSSIDEAANALKQTIAEAHEPMQQIAAAIRADVKQLSDKNLFYLYREVDFLRDRMKQAMEEKYEKELYQYDLIQMMLRPDDGFQERKWNPLPLLNSHGKEFIRQAVNHPSCFTEKHYAVYLK
ncbi:bacillithiol biosynthesis cysteine-adding enzyme BshC [Oceanobacillus sp. FSL H7-0719]|uniref:bacillithiol biosynthesis cysteine-adding enzyme BshC n=1 Tax=Oceanobacillus sp. FSL H7-0719 TaxID=2954507 RepID=UPI00324A6638